MTAHRILLVIFCLIITTACSRQPAPLHHASSPRIEASYLTYETAQLRKSQLSNIQYQLDFTLNAEGDPFSGKVDIDFELAPQQQAITVDFAGGEVVAVSINGKASQWDYNDYFITLDENLFKTGSNRLTIEFSHAYSNTGAGLYFFKDTADGLSYTYTNFEPFAANQLFPAFDQPDLKASYTLTARVPASWQVIANTREQRIETEGEQRVWYFPTTTIFSTYIFALHAGDYQLWEDKTARIPSRIFARQSLADYIPTEQWFRETQQGFDYFEDFFGVPYPFGKYDQIMVPDFVSGAMENVGAVTFSERYLSKGDMTRSQRRALANTNMHEMAHMWFGNLVTMGWWNGLWLNESFADFTSHLAISEATEYSEIWEEFYARRKQWGYAEDQLVTTHPIELPVADTFEAMVNFDGITYAKGGSALKQLRHYLGSDIYQQGVSDYMNQHSWGNTELSDFLNALTKASGKDLNQWSEQWLKTSGFNTLQADYQCEQNRITRFNIIQTAAERTPTLRTHRIQVALFDFRAQAIAVEKITLSGKTTPVPALEGKACPMLVYPNYEDWTFVKVLLDEKSTETVTNFIHLYKDPLLRAMLWQSLWDAVEDARLPLAGYVDIVATHIDNEENLTILKALSTRLEKSLWLTYQTEVIANDKDGILVLREKLQQITASQLIKSDPGSDRQKLWFDTLTKVATTSTAQKMLAHWLKQGTLNGWQVDQDRRWRALISLSNNGYQDTLVLANEERKKDQSAEAEKSLIAVQSSWPDKGNKTQWLEQLVNDDTLPFATQRTIITHLFPAQQHQLKKSYYAQLLEGLYKLDNKRSQTFLRDYSAQLLKGLCEEENQTLLLQQQQYFQTLSPASVKGLKNAAQLNQRCIDIATRSNRLAAK